MKRMSLKSIWRGKGNGRESKQKRRGERKRKLGRGRSYVAPERLPQALPAMDQESSWADLPSDLLFDIIKRVEESASSWPYRRDVVSCAAVCRSWREATKQVVKSPEQCGLVTFPVSLKQPGPRDSPIQCYIKRDRTTSTFQLYLGVAPGYPSKLVLTAHKANRLMCTEFLISLSSNDFSSASDNYVGKLKSNFIGTKFAIYDSQFPLDLATKSHARLHKRFMGSKVPAKLPVRKYNVAAVSYDANVLRTDGPRKMQCSLHTIPSCAFGNEYRSCTSEPMEFIHRCSDPLILRNKPPRWHEQLQCWCLNFNGRATVASVKNFQLAAAVGGSPEHVILQFGKIGKDIFTMDYCYPLSAFQAFAICLSSFGPKLACE